MNLEWWIEVVVKVLVVFMVVLTAVAYMVLLERRVQLVLAGQPERPVQLVLLA